MYGCEHGEVWGVFTPLSASVRHEPDFKIAKAYMNLSVKDYKLNIIIYFKSAQKSNKFGSYW